MTFSIIDYIVFTGYCLIIVGLGLFISTRKKRSETNSNDYFLAGRALPWWAIGASLIASNISAEQFIGMSGSGYAIGLAIASYEWMAALTLLIVAVFFLPIFSILTCSSVKSRCASLKDIFASIDSSIPAS